MSATGAFQLHFPFLFVSLSLLHPNSFAVGQWLWWQAKDNASKDNIWVPIDKTESEEPLMPGDVEVVEAEVLVLGAGMAGITVAQRLKEEGVEGVVVVEGSDRIGGRVKDVQFGGITVELGANWVHRLIYQSSGGWINIQMSGAHSLESEFFLFP